MQLGQSYHVQIRRIQVSDCSSAGFQCRVCDTSHEGLLYAVSFKHRTPINLSIAQRKGDAGAELTGPSTDAEGDGNPVWERAVVGPSTDAEGDGNPVWERAITGPSTDAEGDGNPIWERAVSLCF